MCRKVPEQSSLGIGYELGVQALGRGQSPKMPPARDLASHTGEDNATGWSNTFGRVDRRPGGVHTAQIAALSRTENLLAYFITEKPGLSRISQMGVSQCGHYYP